MQCVRLDWIFDPQAIPKMLLAQHDVEDLQQIYILVFYNINHCTCQCGLIWREIKKGVRWNPYFVVKYIGMKPTQSDRLLVGDKMNLMTFICEGF